MSNTTYVRLFRAFSDVHDGERIRRVNWFCPKRENPPAPYEYMAPGLLSGPYRMRTVAAINGLFAYREVEALRDYLAATRGETLNTEEFGPGVDLARLWSVVPRDTSDCLRLCCHDHSYPLGIPVYGFLPPEKPRRVIATPVPPLVSDDDEINLPNLGEVDPFVPVTIRVNYYREYGECGICGDAFALDIGPELFLRGANAPVCETCALWHAPKALLAKHDYYNLAQERYSHLMGAESGDR